LKNWKQALSLAKPQRTRSNPARSETAIKNHLPQRRRGEKAKPVLGELIYKLEPGIISRKAAKGAKKTCKIGNNRHLPQRRRDAEENERTGVRGTAEISTKQYISLGYSSSPLTQRVMPSFIRAAPKFSR